MYACRSVSFVSRFWFAVRWAAGALSWSMSNDHRLMVTRTPFDAAEARMLFTPSMASWPRPDTTPFVNVGVVVPFV